MAQLDLLSSPAIHLPPPGAASASKADGAYKTISEVADELDVPQHVLRFWESNFPQVKPSRMRGSRRYYRPEDVETLKLIKTLLYGKGYTIKGAKKVVSGREPVAETSSVPATPLTRSAAKRAAAGKSVPAKPAATDTGRGVDKKALVSELRVLKSMLTSLL